MNSDPVRLLENANNKQEKAYSNPNVRGSFDMQYIQDNEQEVDLQLPLSHDDNERYEEPEVNQPEIKTFERQLP